MDEARIKLYLDQSLMLVTALTPKIGYDKTTQAAHKAYKENLTLKEACMQLKLLSEAEYDELIVPSKMIAPH